MGSEMSVAEAPRTCLDGMLECVSEDLEHVLELMPDRLLEARMLVTREFGFEPHPEELQAIVRLARESSRPSICRDLPRQLLGLKLMVEQARKDFWDSPGLDHGIIRRVREAVPELIQAACEIESRLGEAIEGSGLALHDVDYLRDIAAALSPPLETLTAISILGPRLEAIAEHANTSELKASVPNLVQAEIDWIEDSLCPDGPGEAGPSRVCVDAIALRTLIQDAIDSRRTVLADPDGNGAHQIPRAGATSLGQIETAYRVVSERLQKQQDIALAAGLHEFSDDMRRIRGDLFSSYRRLATLCATGPASDVPRTTLLDRSGPKADAQRDGAAATQQQRSVRPAASVDRHPSLRHGRFFISERWRMSSMLGAAGILFALTLAVYLTAPEAPYDPTRPALSSATGAGLEPAPGTLGMMLYERVDSWNRLSAEDRLGRVEQLGRQARNDGYAAVYIADGQGNAVALWSEIGGARLF